MLRYRHVGRCGMMVPDRSRGRVRGRPGAPLIRYDLCREDVATVHAALVRLAELLAAAGATPLYLALTRLPELRALALDAAVAGALGVNPQITIMAPATRLALLLRGEPCPS
jgi:hypothetical protein